MDLSDIDCFRARVAAVAAVGLTVSLVGARRTVLPLRPVAVLLARVCVSTLLVGNGIPSAEFGRGGPRFLVTVVEGG